MNLKKEEYELVLQLVALNHSGNEIINDNTPSVLLLPFSHNLLERALSLQLSVYNVGTLIYIINYTSKLRRNSSNSSPDCLGDRYKVTMITFLLS